MAEARAERALALASRLLALVTGADQASVAVTIAESAYSRYTHDYVTQNLERAETTLTLTFVKDRRMGSATTGDTTDDGFRALARRMAESTARLPVNEEFVSLATMAKIPAGAKSSFAATVDATPDARLDALQPVFARMRASNIYAAGYVRTEHSAYAVANSLGVRAAWEGSSSGMEVKAIAPQTSGFASEFNRDFTAIDFAALAERAAGKATVSPVPEDLAPGTYTVILEPPALVDCINNLYYGFDLGAVRESRDSWLIGRRDTALFSPNVTIVDDWSYPLLANAPFASDGAPTQRVSLVERGVPKNDVSSTYLANKYKTKPTGHDGYPTNAVVMPGSKSRERLIAETERGILVSRTWYTRPVNSHDATITGLTRDGVFLIEHGRLTKSLKNFRFFTSLLVALADVEFSDRLVLAESSDAPGLLAVPDAKIAKWTFSSQASFA